MNALHFKIKNRSSGLKDLKVACILDELSTYFFSYECRCLELEPEKWLEQLDTFQPDMLFIESAWKGKQDKWYKKIYTVSTELKGIINWCRKRSIPTVFWNKEDPIHMSTFLRAAFLFDYVYTTDMDCVPLYKRLLKHDRVDVLPFASPLYMFNPIEKYKRKKAACFAGSYYLKQAERKEDFEKLVDFLLESGWPLEIYDRNPYPGNPEYTFPEKYQQYIVGSNLPVTKVDIAYKGYDLAITMNIVKHSSTMEARRAFELLSSNTLVISNPCQGLKNLFGDIILFMGEDCGQRLREINADDTLSKKIRLIGLRKVLTEHTYRHRLLHIYEAVYGHPPGDKTLQVCVFAVARSEAEYRAVLTGFDRQRYQAKKLLIFSNLPGLGADREDVDVRPVDTLKSSRLAVLEPADYYACFAAGNYYGANYLVDLIATTEYEMASVIGKGRYYAVVDGAPALQDTGRGEYTFYTEMLLDRSIVREPVAGSLGYAEVTARGYLLEGFPSLSVDLFNFCQGFSGTSCPAVDDITLNEGIGIDDLYRISRNLPANAHFEYDGVLSPREFYQSGTAKATPAVSLLEDGSMGLVSQSESTPVVAVTKVMDLPRGKTQGTLDIYLDALTVGSVSYYVDFIPDQKAKSSKRSGQSYSFLVPEKSFTKVKIPDGVLGYRISARAVGRAASKLKEIIINPRCLSPIKLPAERETE